MFHVRGETDGYENTFALHTLGAYLLTESLMPLMERTQPRAVSFSNCCCINKNSITMFMKRVVTMTSGGLYTVKMSTSDDFQSPKSKVYHGDGLNSDGAIVYAQCKRQQMYLTQCWAAKKVK